MGNRGTAQTGEGSKGWQHNTTRICRVSTIFADSVGAEMALFFLQKREKRVEERWRKLVRGALIKDRVQEKFKNINS